MTALDVRPLDSIEAARFYKTNLGIAMRGVAARSNGLTVIVGGVTLGTDGRHWAFMDFAPGYGTPLMLKHIKRFLTEIREAGARQIHTARDTTFEGSSRLLERCGFKKTDEIIDGKEVWIWRA